MTFAGPEPAAPSGPAGSVAVKPTVVFALTQPALFSSGVSVTWLVGRLRSTFTLAVYVCDSFPAASIAV